MILMGARYRLMSHPDQPIGITKGHRPGEILVVWENTTLIPPNDWYSEDMFANGKFELIRADHSNIYEYVTINESVNFTCAHEWKQYYGFNEDYEYCTKCDVKK